MSRHPAGVLIPVAALVAVMVGMAVAFHMTLERPLMAQRTGPRMAAASGVSSRASFSAASSMTASAAGASAAASSPYAHFKLHPAGTDKPSDSVCKAARRRAFAGLDSAKIQTLRDVVHEQHVTIENDFIHKSLSTRLADPQSIYWEEWEHLGRIQYPGSEFIDNQRDGDTIVAALEKAAALENDTLFHADLTAMENLVRQAVQNHDLSRLIRYHQMIHDMDYWVVNYPISYPKLAPPDWAGVGCCFHSLSGLQAVDSAGTRTRQPR